jgi:hypothetical protein
MQIAIISNNAVTQVGDYKDLFPNVSFPSSGPNAEWLTENSCMQCNLYLAYDPLTQALEPSTPTINNGMVDLVKVVELTADQITANKASALAGIRATRNALLTACDYTQTPDNPSPKKAAWATYRQALRDIPETITSGNLDPRTWNSWPHNPDYVAPTIGTQS